jgi:chloride channel 3/4/5
MQLFRRMGPRVILVEDRGALVGLCTVKDVLHLDAAALDIDTPRLAASWSRSGGLDGALEEVRGGLGGVVTRLREGEHAARAWFWRGR